MEVKTVHRTVCELRADPGASCGCVTTPTASKSVGG
jgi:hypothetical protein